MPINLFKDLACPDSANLLRIDPPNELQQFVEGYYIFNSAETKGKRLFFNDGYPVVAFLSKKTDSTVINVDGKSVQIGPVYVCGGTLRNIYADDVKAPLSKLFVIRFYPTTFFKLFNLSEKHFSEKQVFDFLEIAGEGGETLIKKYYENPASEERVQTVSEFLVRKIKSYSCPELLSDLLGYIEQHEVRSVKALMEGFGTRLNYKWLERNFRKHIGTSPKNYLLNKRFLAAYLDMLSFQKKALIQVALDNGYYDANHLIKDFRKFSGDSPKTFFEK